MTWFKNFIRNSFISRYFEVRRLNKIYNDRLKTIKENDPFIYK